MKIIFLLGAAVLALFQASSPQAQTRAAAVVDDGYAGKALQKIMNAFSGSVPGGQRLEAKISLDAEGRYLECRSLKGDVKALCKAAKNASPYGDPPYGVATDFVVAIWTGKAEAAKTAAVAKAEASPAGAQDSKYLAKIRRELRNAMYIPEKTRPGTYHATARLSCDATGKILQSSIVKGSGDNLLDKYVLQGIQRAGKVTAPPKGMPQTFDLTFTLVRQ